MSMMMIAKFTSENLLRRTSTSARGSPKSETTAGRQEEITWHWVTVKLDDDVVGLRLERCECDAVMRDGIVSVDEVGRRVGGRRHGYLEVADSSATSVN